MQEIVIERNDEITRLKDDIANHEMIHEEDLTRYGLLQKVVEARDAMILSQNKELDHRLERIQEEIQKLEDYKISQIKEMKD